jgi:sialic acid synthase SpsE
LRAFFARFELDEAAHARIAQRAHAAGIALISTPFDETAIDLLQRIGVDALKIASGDITHHRLIARAAGSGLPLILSTGMSEMAEVEAAVACARRGGATSLALLHCVSAYPVPDGFENLGAVRTLAARFEVPVGLSDHGRNRLAVPVAVALGAAVYERHLVLTAGDDAIDGAVSSTPGELTAAIVAAEQTRRLLGHGRRECLEVERPNRVASRRGFYAARPVPAGATLRAEDIVCLRPEHVLSATQWEAVAGARVRADLPAGAPITLAVLERNGD